MLSYCPFEELNKESEPLLARKKLFHYDSAPARIAKIHELRFTLFARANPPLTSTYSQINVSEEIFW